MPLSPIEFQEGERHLHKKQLNRLGPLSMEGGKGLIVLVLDTPCPFSLPI